MKKQANLRLSLPVHKLKVFQLSGALPPDPLPLDPAIFFSMRTTTKLGYVDI